MTEEQKKKIFEYMGWEMPCDGNEHNLFACLSEGSSGCTKCEYYHPIDGNDVVAAKDKMSKKEEWADFVDFSIRYMYGLHVKPLDVELTHSEIIYYLMQPERFFELMLSWLKEKEHENSRT